MNFCERVENLLHTLFMTLALETVISPLNELKNSFNLTPERSFRESRKMMELVTGAHQMEPPSPLIS